MRHILSHMIINSVAISGVTTRSFDDGIEMTKPLTDSGIDPGLVAIVAGAPVMTFSTLDLSGGLTALSFSTPVETSVIAYDLLQGADGGLASGLTPHISHTAATALVLPTGLSASTGGNAVLNGAAFAFNAAGTAIPVLTATGVAAPVLPGLNEKVYGLGPVTIGGTTIAGTSSVNVAFGISATPVYADGVIYPKGYVINSRISSITVNNVLAPDANVRGGTTPNLGGPKQIASNVVVYFRKRTGVGYVADGTMEHISLTIAAGTINATSKSGSRPGSIDTTYEIHPQGATQVVVDTTAAMP